MFSKKFKKYLTIAIILVMIFVRGVIPFAVMAEETTPTPTSETQTEEQISDPETNSADTTQSDSTSQESTKEDSPTEDTSINTLQNLSSDSTDMQEQALIQNENLIAPAPTQSANIIASNSAEIDNNVESGANTGGNIATKSADLNPDPANLNYESSPQANTSNLEDSNNESKVNTGNAAAITVAENILNTNVVNSTILHHTINLFVNENGNLDLSDPFEIAKNIVVEEQNTDSVVNVVATNTENYAYLSNDVVSIANTGGNTLESSMSATVNTGNAVSVVSLLNQVNFNIQESVLHIVTINIFGKLSGDIVLPEFSKDEVCNECGTYVKTENQATVNNTINSQANTGGNEIEYSENGSITTGDAQSVVNITNWINTNIIGTLLFNLVINVFGEWNGGFLGWGENIPAGNGSIFNYINDTNSTSDSCCIDATSISNTAVVNNNIVSIANTGENLIKGELAEINTGQAISIVSLNNFINTNFIDSVGFFGFVNIFGEWDGDIGGASKFITITPAPSSGEQTTTQTESLSNESKETGGQLAVTNQNNVGTHVNPGDTVTFFIDVKNLGTGKVYNTKLHLFLVHDGKNVGGTTFELGEIQPGKKSKITTGFVLSDLAPKGNYTAVALAVGETNDGQIKTFSESYFLVGEIGYEELAIGNTNQEKTVEEKPHVLGQGSISQETAESINDKILLALVLIAYLITRLIRKKRYLKELFAKGLTFKERANSFRVLLF